MYFYGLIVATTLIVGTILTAMGINRLRERWERRERERRTH